ncbi:MAG: DMT family transporter [Oscillospiraceae bacterium]|nr:DMT family transporter [Oscillospiraceae bacterium]
MRKSKIQFLSAMGIFGTIGIFVRYLPLSSGMIAFARGVMGLLCLCAVMFVGKQKPDFSAIRKNLPILLLSGAAMGFNWVLLFESYRYTTIATATVCYYLAPLLLLLVCPLLGEKLTIKKILCICAALSGLVCVSGITESGLPALQELKGVLLGVGAAVLYATVMFLNKKLSPIPAYDKTILQLGSAVLVLLPYLLLTQSAALPEMTAMQWAVLLLLGILHTGIAYTLYFGSMKNLQAHTIAVFSYLDPVLAVVLSALLLKEPMSPANIVGTVLILGSAIYSELT